MFHYKKKPKKKTTTEKKPNNLNPACASDIYLLKYKTMYSHFLRQTWI